MYHRTSQMHRWLALLLAVGLLGAIAPPLRAQNVSEGKAAVSPTGTQGQILLAEAIRLYDELEWDDALTKLQEALTSLRADRDRTGQANAHWYLAVVSRAQGDLENARISMVEVVRLNPEFALPETLAGTDFEVLLKDALAQADRNPPQIVFVTQREVQQNRPVRVVVEIQDDSPIEQVEITYQRPGAAKATISDVRQEAGNRWVGEIPAKVTANAAQITIQVSALDAWQNVHAESDTIRFPKKEGGNGMLYLIGAAVAAVGGGIAALVLGGGSDSPDPDNKPDETPDNGDDTWPKSSAPLPPQ